MKKGLLIFTCLLPQLILANETNPQCYNYLTELVRSSDFPFKEIPKTAVETIKKSCTTENIYNRTPAQTE